MNTRLLKHLGVVAALVGSVMSASVANAALVLNSVFRFDGNAFVTAASVTGPTAVTSSTSGNTLSFVNANAVAPFAVTLTPFNAVGPNGVILTVPTGAVPGFTFNLPSYTSGPGLFSAFLIGGTGTLFETGTAQSYVANFSLVVNNYVAGERNPFVGSVEIIRTGVIPVPGAMWIFGSGLLLMTAVMRRKAK